MGKNAWRRCTSVWSGTDGNGRAWNPDMQDYKAESQGSSRYGYSNAQQSPVLYGSTTGTKAGGIVMIAAGGSIALIFLILFLASCIASLPESPGALWIMRAVFGLFTVASGMITGWGIKLLKQVGRFKNYSRRIAGREYCNISEIGSNSGKSIKFVTKDLERMISKGTDSAARRSTGRSARRCPPGGRSSRESPSRST